MEAISWRFQLSAALLHYFINETEIETKTEIWNHFFFAPQVFTHQVGEEEDEVLGRVPPEPEAALGDVADAVDADRRRRRQEKPAKNGLNW